MAEANQADTRVFVGIGSNLDSPLDQAETAITALARLPESALVARSSWYRSRALGPGAQPDYINGVALLSTRLPPHDLLAQLQQIEQRQGRVRTVRWGPRTLDLDLLLYGDLQLQDPLLTLPHPGLQLRNFVLMPLAEIAADLRLPDGEAISGLLAKCSSAGIVRLRSGV